MAKRPLHFIWIADCSGSMAGRKIQTLNQAIREAIPEMQKVADGNPNAEVLVRAVKFATGAQWHISQPTKVNDFRWPDLTADGLTDMGQAMRLVADALKVSAMGEHGLPPVLVLLSDGQPTDDFSGGLKALMAENWARKAVRIAIAIETETDHADHDVLQKFIGHNELKPLVARNSPTLVKLIKWCSTAVLKSASAPASQPKGTPAGVVNVPVPTPPATSGPIDPTDVW
jgi:uncharacterized protein YegL